MRQRRFTQNVLIVRVALPGTKIFDKAARIVLLAGHLRQGAEMRQIVLNAFFKTLQFICIEHASNHNSP